MTNGFIRSGKIGAFTFQLLFFFFYKSKKILMVLIQLLVKLKLSLSTARQFTLSWELKKVLFPQHISITNTKHLQSMTTDIELMECRQMRCDQKVKSLLSVHFIHIKEFPHNSKQFQLSVINFQSKKWRNLVMSTACQMGISILSDQWNTVSIKPKHI